MISGPDYSYFWILARKPHLDQKIMKKLTQKAEELGFDTSKLIYVAQQ
jgi:apolipoprotein D and lipocalin family protein